MSVPRERDRAGYVIKRPFNTAIDKLAVTLETEAPTDEVWRAITEPSRTRQYFYDMALHSNWQPASPISYDLPDGTAVISGRLLEFDPPRRFAMTALFRFDPRARGEGESRITWELAPHGSSTLVTFVHDRIRNRPVTRRIVRTGWPAVIDGLSAYLVPYAVSRILIAGGP
jgi:uncharacterized protein YndB with AHSA1/START domain